MDDNKTKARFNPYARKTSKGVVETKAGNTQAVLGKELAVQAFKIDEVNDWTKIVNEEKTMNKGNSMIKQQEVYSPMINNEDLFKNKQFRSNKEAFEAKKNETLNEYSVNTSMFTQEDFNDRNNHSFSMNTTHMIGNKGKTRRYRGNGQSFHLNLNDKEIKPVIREAFHGGISPIEKLNKLDDNCEEYNENDIEEQIIKAKELIANLGSEIDEMRIAIAHKEKEDNFDNEDSLDDNKSKKALNSKDARINILSLKNKRAAQEGIDEKEKTEVKTMSIPEIKAKPIQTKENEQMKANTVTTPPLSTDIYQNTPNVLMPVYNNQIPFPVQMNPHTPFELIQPSIVNYPNQIFAQAIDQYQPLFNPYMYYQYEPLNYNTLIQPELYPNYPRETPRLSYQKKETSVISIKPKAKVPKQKKEAEQSRSLKQNSKQNEVKKEENRTEATTKPTSSGYNHIYLLKQMKNKIQLAPIESKDKSKRPSSINHTKKDKETKEEKPHNKIYTTMKHHLIKKPNNNKERITSAKTAINQSNNSSNTTNIGNMPCEIEQMNELFKNHQLYSEKASKIKETLN